MKKFQKLIALAAVAAMLLGMLAACGSTAETTEETSESAAAETTEETAEETSEEATEEASAEAASFTTVEEGKLHMSTNAAFPPYEMVTDDGGFEGIDVEVATAIAEKLGLELVVDDMDFDAALLAAQNGQSDIVMAGVTITEEREKVMDFSDSYATAKQVIIVKEGSEIASVDDLANAAMIGTQKATTGYIYCSDDYGEDHVTAFDTGALAVQALMNGTVDCVVIDNEPAKAYVEANEGLVILETEYVTENYAIGTAKGNDALLSAVNDALAELQADGTLQSIVDKYITAE